MTTERKAELLKMVRKAMHRKANESGFQCMQCGRKFRTIKAAESASYDGCPKCGACDIDQV